jgi:hypothetical protein
LYPFEETPHTKFGNEVHSALEKAVKRGIPIDPKFAAFQWAVDLVNALPRTASLLEVDMSVDKAGVHVGARDWASKYITGKSDVLLFNGPDAIAIDYKTGKASNVDLDQLELMAYLVFLLYPEINTVRSAFLFLQSATVAPPGLLVTTRAELAFLHNKFAEQIALVDRAHISGVWPMKKSGLCKGWCPVNTCPNWSARK